MKLPDLLDPLPFRLLAGSLDMEVPGGVATDTRRVRGGALFVAVAGRRHDGHALLGEAFANGAVAAVVSDPGASRPEGMTVVLVPDTLAAASLAAARYHGEPGRRMTVVSITGTNGKTSVAAMLESVIRSLSPDPVGVVGTGGARLDGRAVSLPTSTPTTPQAVELQAILRAMADRGAGTVVLEASSVALLQHRVDHAFTDVGVFTNLSPDHLDDHGTMDAYRQAKMLLFSGLAGRAVANADDPVSAEIRALMPGRVTGYGVDRPADLRAVDVQVSPSGSSFVLVHDGRSYRVRIPVPGRFAVSNALAALAVCHLLGYELEHAVSVLGSLPQIPGRMETVRLADGVTVVVDYAHSVDALEKVLRTLRDVAAGGRLVTVFGCGGDRDRGKRAPMGSIAGRLSDHVIITSDNPRTEDPEAILDMVEQGVRASGVPYDRLADRREAIALALAGARPGDTVLIAGKGSEQYQIVGEHTVPFQDMAVVRELAAAV